MGKRISAASRNAKAELPEQVPNGWAKPVKARAKNVNDHQQKVRVHPALPAIAWSSQATELCQASTSLQAT
jgi:hypothetical protein